MVNNPQRSGKALHSRSNNRRAPALWAKPRDMVKSQKRVMTLAIALSLVLALTIPVSAMHIAEGFLAPMWALSWGVVCIPFVAYGFLSIKRKAAENRKTLVLLALCGAFAFVLSALKIPSVSGSCSHPTGVGLGAILFGPSAMSVIGVIILLFQATLLAHGGLTTLGANTFSMGIAGPLASFFVYKLARRLKCSTAVAVFLAAFLGDLVTYCVTSVQLGIAYPDAGSIGASLAKFLGIFAVTQIPLAVCEGLLTVVVFGVLEKYNAKELRELAVI